MKEYKNILVNHSPINVIVVALIYLFSVSFSNSFPEVIDENIAFPILTSFSDNDSDNQIQPASDVVFTAVFQSSVSISPTVEIPGAISGGTMESTDGITWRYLWDVDGSGATDGNYTARVQTTDPDDNTTQISTQSLTFVLDSSVPTVILEDTDTDNLLTIYDTVRITATFSQPMASSPIINIVRGSTTVTSTALTQSSTTIWYYDWILTTPSAGIPNDGFYTVTVSGTSQGGKAYLNGNIDNILFEITDDSDGDEKADGGADKDDDNDGILDSV